MPIFDTKELLDALSPPVFRHEGREFVGVFLSLPEWIRMNENAALITSLEDERAYLRRATDAIFPPPPRVKRRWWERGPAPPPSVAEILDDLPLVIARKLVEGFIASQAQALAPEPTLGSGTTVPEPL
jgi:hypothetical protein